MESLQPSFTVEEEEEARPPNQEQPLTENDSELPQNDGEMPPNDDVVDEEDASKRKQGEQQDAFVSASETLSESEPSTSNNKSPKTEPENDDVLDSSMNNNEEEEDEDEDRPRKKQKPLSSFTRPGTSDVAPAIDEVNGNGIGPLDDNDNAETLTPAPTSAAKKKSTAKKKKNNNNMWVTKSTRKGKKKAKQNLQTTPAEDKVLITPVPRYLDKSDDSPEMTVCLSKVYKAEKVELSEDRLTAGSTKGYRMVRATRGVSAGAWYFEIKVVSLGESGHTRLGWSTEKGDLQAPVGYDGNSFGYRDIDGSKVHKAVREKYGEEGYKEGDVIGFYINLPDGGSYAPKPPQLVWYKGQRYICAPDPKEDPPKIVPGSEISFFKNGVCQGVAFKDLYGGRYYPGASMYTLPNQPNCIVRFNFGPDFEFFPEDFGGRPVPRPMIDVPYHGFDVRVENGVSNEK